MQFLGDLDDLLRVVGIRALSDFKLQKLSGQMIFLHKLFDDIDKLSAVKINTGHIYRYRRRIPVLVNPFPEQTAGFLPHELVELKDKAVMLEHRDELSRGYFTAHRMNPAHKCLRAYYAFCCRVVLRLHVYLEFAPLQRFHHVIYDALLRHDVMTHCFIVFFAVENTASLRLHKREGRPVAHRADGDSSVIYNIYAEAQHDAVAQRKA